MVPRPGERCVDATTVRRELGLVLRRAALGSLFLAAALTLGLRFGSWLWLPALLLAVPGLFTLAAIRQPWVAPCPGCGSLLGASLVNLPDEPLIAQRVEDYRCRACGIYVDSAGGAVREVPFQRCLEGPGYEVALDFHELPALDWGRRCVACGAEATRSLRLAAAELGVLSGPEADFEAGPDPGRVPYCAVHGDATDPLGRALVVARAGRRVVIQLTRYGSLRALLDANRARLDLAVRG